LIIIKDPKIDSLISSASFIKFISFKIRINSIIRLNQRLMKQISINLIKSNNLRSNSKNS